MDRPRLAGVLVALALVAGVIPAQAHSESQRNYPEFTYERVRVEMRDGIELSVDIWRPVTPKKVKVPVILSLTPYHVLYKALDANEANLPSGDAALFVPKGYAYALGDVRGTY
ncbi:MAG: CocE/NonD family hydrolase, partial [Actinomycetota bacterium]